mmetsp:Transcript_19596/g.36006  ORF Transcript_19596/g.36006 Transcript_19596/m.36006 type:complete len:167 (-) Transcript_19596:523-1023(-)
MVSRGVFQLKNLKLLFCDFGGRSQGIRNLLQTEKLDEFVTQNPQIKFEAIVKTGFSPYIKTEYVNGWTRTVDLSNASAEEVLEAIQSARDQLGRRALKHSGNKVVSTNPSIQGKWRPNMWNTAHIYEDSKHEQYPEYPHKAKLVPVKPKRERNPTDFAKWLATKKS